MKLYVHLMKKWKIRKIKQKYYQLKRPWNKMRKRQTLEGDLEWYQVNKENMVNIIYVSFKLLGGLKYHPIYLSKSG